MVTAGRTPIRRWQDLTGLLPTVLAILGIIIPYLVLVVVKNLDYPHIINPDGINYAQLASEYAHGRFHNAINGYWGPALSWLMAPLMVAGVDAMTSYRIVNALALLGSVAAFWRLLVILDVHPCLRFAAIWAFGLMALPWSLEQMTPDILMLCATLWYATAILEVDTFPSRNRMIAIGLLGGSCFLVKPFGLMFFLTSYVALALVVAIRYWGWTTPWLLLRRFAVGMLACLALVVSWVAAMSWKYGHLTLGSSGRRNLTIAGPHPPALSREEAQRLLPPAFPGANYRLDPTLVPDPQWNPLASVPDALFFVRNIAANVREVATDFSTVLWVWVPVTLVCLLGLMRRRDPALGQLTLALSVSAGFVSLYCLVLIEIRYLWPAVALAFLVSLGAISRLAAGHGRTRRASLLLAVPLLIVMTLGQPAVWGRDWSPRDGIGRQTFSDMFGMSEIVAEMSRRAMDAADALDIDASGMAVASSGNLIDAMFVAYYLDATYVGEVDPGAPPEATARQLEELRVDLFCFWPVKGSTERPTYLDGFAPTATLHDGAMIVYVRTGT